MPPPRLPDLRSPPPPHSPPPIFPNMSLPPPNLLPLNQPPPTLPSVSLPPPNQLSQKSPVASQSLTHAPSSGVLKLPPNNSEFSSRSNLVEDVLSEEEKLKVKVIQSNLREMERRKASEASKSMRKSNPTKSKNLISLVWFPPEISFERTGLYLSVCLSVCWSIHLSVRLF